MTMKTSFIIPTNIIYIDELSSNVGQFRFH